MNRRSLIAAIVGAPVAGVAAVAAARPRAVLILGEGNFVVNGVRVIVRQPYDPRMVAEITDRVSAQLRDKRRRGQL
jgi:hypothetical protein